MTLSHLKMTYAEVRTPAMIKDRATVQRIFLPDGQYGLRDRFDPCCRPGDSKRAT